MKKLIQSLFLFMIISVTAMAQSRTVTGTVTAKEDKMPIPGVSVRIKGTQTGAVTDGNGKYTLQAPSSTSVLEFSYIGYITVAKTVGSTAVINVELVGDENQLQEVVVVGYGSTTKEAFTGSAKKVSQENIERKSVSNISQALSGEVAGLQVINTSGQPGESATIRIRGFGSVNGSRDPLYVVDGVPFTGGISSVNPADIESTTILKDAAATAIYGSRGANGVIIINTKSGRGKKSFIEADLSFGANMSLIPRYSTMKSPEQYIGLSWEAMYNEGVALGAADPVDYANKNLFSDNGISPLGNMWKVKDGAELIDPATRQVRAGVQRLFDPENWEDYAFQDSYRNDFNVKFGGSSDKTNYFTSVGYLKDKGYSINSDFERFSARLNLNHEVKSWLNMGMNFGFSQSTRNVGGQSQDSGSIFWFVDNMPSIYPLFERDANGNKINDPIFGGYLYDYGMNNERKFGSLTNALADATYDILRHKRNELNGRGYANFNLAKGLTLENSFGAQYYNNIYNDRGNKYYGSSATMNGSLYQQRTEMFTYNLLNLLRYKTSFGQHNLEGLVAHEASKWDSEILSVSGHNLVDPDILDFNNVIVSDPVKSYKNNYALESYFAQVNYNYKNTYYLSGSLRRDGSSRFLNDKWGTFGSVGAGWIVSNEDFMSKQNVLRFLKLKASYGVLGDQAGVGYYPGFDLYDVENLNNNAAFAFYSKGNKDLTWETSKMFQTGVEFEIGKYFSATVDYYIKNTSNLIFRRQVGPSLGYRFVQVNGGNLRNSGIEFDLTGHIIKTKDAFFDISLNGESFRNKITAMPIDPVTGQPKGLDIQSPYAWSKGHSIFDFYTRDFTGVDPQDGRSMWKVYYTDMNGDGQFNPGEQIASLGQFTNPNNLEIKEGTTKTYSQATQHYVGKSAIPKIRGAFNLRGGYKGFELAVQMLYSLGGYSYDYAYAGLMSNTSIGGNNWHTDILDRWQKPGDVTDVPRLSNDYDQNVVSSSTRFLTKSNFLALNNVRLSYDFASDLTQRLGMNGLSVWVSGDNLWMHSQRKGFNPSGSEAGSSSTYSYSPLSTVSAGLRVKF